MTEQKGKCPGVFEHRFVVPDTALDPNGHVNNVEYVRWMQDVAILHSVSVGGIDAAQVAGGTWVTRSHRIEYLSPAFAGDEIIARTWVSDLRRVRSTRRYRFTRTKDGRTIAKGETVWVFVDALTGRPRTVPPELVALFPVLPDAAE